MTIVFENWAKQEQYHHKVMKVKEVCADRGKEIKVEMKPPLEISARYSEGMGDWRKVVKSKTGRKKINVSKDVEKKESLYTLAKPYKLKTLVVERAKDILKRDAGHVYARSCQEAAKMVPTLMIPKLNLQLIPEKRPRCGVAAVEAVLNEKDLLKFEKKFQSEKAAGSVSKSTQFEYAWCLVRSKYNDDIRKGIALLEELLPKGSKEEQWDYVFYLAVGNYRLKEYEKALKYVRGLLQREPQNNQAKELERLIDKAMKKDGLVGMAIVGGMALGVAGLAGLIRLAVSKSKS
ncbi:mitochondrial fission 1 protein-like [Mirounga angustirostris]|uniref:mitochondrial fission 1 protein-like n=1 Tax=Mirounga angustirostris TaxID=9716 RepID=UPI00313D73E4